MVRRTAVLELVVQTDRTELSIADRSGMGIRGPRGNDDSFFHWRDDHGQRCQLRRGIRVRPRAQGRIPEANDKGWDIQTQCLWIIRYARQCLGMGSGLLA